MRANHFGDLPANPVEGMQARKRVLENHRDPRPANRPQFGRRHRQEFATLKDRLAGDPRAARESGDGLCRDTFSRSGFPDDSQSFSTLHAERNTAHSFDMPSGCVKGNRQITRPQEGDSRVTAAPRLRP